MNRSLAWLWLAAFFLALGFSPGFHSFETPNIDTVENVAHNGRLGFEVSPGRNFFQAPDGRFYEVHDIGAVLFAVPIGVISQRIADATHRPFIRVYELLLTFVGCGLFASTLIICIGLLAHFGIPPEESAFRMFLLLFASQFFVYVVSPPDLAIATPFLAAGLWAWLAAENGARPAWFLTGLLIGAALLIKVSLATFAVVLLVRIVFLTRSMAWVSRLQPMALFCAGLVPSLIVTGLWNHLRTGSALVAPYPEWIHGFRPGYLLFGLGEVWLSPNKGLFVFTPALLLVAWSWRRAGFLRQQPAFAFVIGVSFLLTMFRLSGSIAASSWGGWGNRYYVPWVALFLIPVVADWRLLPRRLAQGLVASGIVINIAALVTNWHFRQSLCGEDSWLWNGTNVCALKALPTNLARALGASIPDVGLNQASAVDVLVSNRLALWWYAIRTAGVPDGASWLIGATVFAAALACALIYLRSLRRGAPGHARLGF